MKFFVIMFLIFFVSKANYADCIVECDQNLALVALRAHLVTACVSLVASGHEDTADCDYFIRKYRIETHELRKMEEECTRQQNKK